MKSYDFLEPAQLELEEEEKFFNEREEGLGTSLPRRSQTRSAGY